ncbi:MAG: SH3 domain-containing protein [Pseudomonadota bacterium]
MRLFLFVIVWLAALPAAAFEFRSLNEAVVLYDAPSLKAKKLFVLGAGYPLEVVVSIEGWSKVRDASGEMAWVENRVLSAQRTALVRMPLADVRVEAAEDSRLSFQAEQNVVLEILEPPGNGWVKVRHRDGQEGYARVRELWGAQ